MLADAKAIVFDLDGTLYVNQAFAREIKESAGRYIASLKGIDDITAGSQLKAARERLSAESGLESTLSAACIELGGDIRQLHAHFSKEIKPELYLNRDDGLVKALEKLAGVRETYIYTNNNRFLCGRILKCLGISGLFRRVFTVEGTWRPKPDISSLRRVYDGIGRPPEECLFIGDRYDVDLRAPASLGSAVCLVRSVRELEVLLHEIAGRNEDPGKII